MLSAICFNLDQSQTMSSGNGLKTFPDNRLNEAHPLASVFKIVENIIRKKENAVWLPAFSSFPSFQKPS